jgi:hypothetical protein
VPADAPAGPLEEREAGRAIALPAAHSGEQFRDPVPRVHGPETLPVGVARGRERHPARQPAAHALIEQGAREAPSSRTIHLLHTGLSDPDLLTVRAARLIRMADLMVHEPAVGPAILDLARRDAVKIKVRPDCGSSPKSQQDISGLLTDYARRGCVSVYLTAGKPETTRTVDRDLVGLAPLPASGQMASGC